MGWELTIYGNAEKPHRPLGTREQVCAHFAARLPGLKLAPVPQAFADHMKDKLKERGLVYHPTLEGYYETAEFVVEFSCTDAEMILDVTANVRGNGDPLPALRGLCAGTSWMVVEDASGENVLAAADSRSGWARFKQWRDRSISMLARRENPNA
jgi:hypothetical protein